jgi:DNA-binding MarR family transcriptional regulator
MIPAALIQAYRDPALKRRDLIVYAFALEALSFYQPRVFKVRAVARASAMHWTHTAACIRRLVQAGYLERGPNDGALRTYLLTQSTRQLAA